MLAKAWFNLCRRCYIRGIMSFNRLMEYGRLNLSGVFTPLAAIYSSVFTNSRKQKLAHYTHNTHIGLKVNVRLIYMGLEPTIDMAGVQSRPQTTVTDFDL